MKEKTLIFLVGETGTGKDTVASHLPYHKIVSYKTGTMRATDVEGRTHNFVSDTEMDDIEKQEGVIAWTKTGKIRYCATIDQLKEDVSIYIINPDGVRWFKKHYKGPRTKFIVIGLFVPLDIRKFRCQSRSDFNSMFFSRVADEQLDYDKFRLDGEFDYMINNVDSTKTAAIIYDIIQKEIQYKKM